MKPYQAPTPTIAFILLRVLDARKQLAALPAHADLDDEILQQVLHEAGKFVTEVVAPTNRLGDEVGCRFDQGVVTTPPGAREAYQAFWHAGWPALASSPDDGGQGLPTVLEAVLYEMLSAANHGWTMAPGLLHGAYECIKHHGNETLKATYLPKLASGEWLATMCLTEPQAGSDLGLARTRATPQIDGSYLLNGTKIFISGGEHDLTDNIVHLVLARMPDAPPGPKGLSLFLVPKFYPDGRRSAVHCERIEEKMGIHASPTCVLRFDDAQGWRVGDPGRGLNAMFVMMNAARLHVALQGIGLLDAAWQKADAYARERRQMRVPGKRQAAEAADLIMGHPAIHRILYTQRAWVLGARVLAYQTGIELDLAHDHPDPARRLQAQSWCSLLTPVLKSACTDQAFSGASECLQVFGGHGYVREWGIEQIVRDARIAMIYEGTNEIQAIDLLIRKALPDQGVAFMKWAEHAQAMLVEFGVSGERCQQVFDRLLQLRRLLALLSDCAQVNAQAPYWVAGDFLRATALAMLDWAWAVLEVRSDDHADLQTCALALSDWVLPEFDLRVATIKGYVQRVTVRLAA